MTTLWDATLALARILMQVRQGLATGGSTTTVVDTALDEPSNYFGTTYRPGTLWLDLATNVSKTITGYTFGASPTITFTPAQATPAPGAVVANDVYYAAPPDFPRYVLIQAINQALQELGPFPTVAEITAVADQQEYDSDDNAIFEEEIVSIELATSSAAPYDWMKIENWDQHELTKRTLVFDEGHEPDVAYTMRVTYLAAHAELSSDSGVVNRLVNPDLLKWQAACYAYQWKITHTKGDEDHWKQQFQYALTMTAKEKGRHPIQDRKRIRPAGW